MLGATPLLNPHRSVSDTRGRPRNYLLQVWFQFVRSLVFLQICVADIQTERTQGGIAV